MAEAGSFAYHVKQQVDIVRVVGEYVRLKKSGQNFSGLCPFHAEKTPSFSVHPVKQMYYCFGCGAGGDVFKFIMEMDKCDFPDAVRTVAEKNGIPVPAQRSPEERREQQQRARLIEMHAEAAAFFARQLTSTPEGKAAAGYMADRGLDAKAMAEFGIGYAPAGGDALLRHLKIKYSGKLFESSGLVGRDGSGRFYDRFRRRVMFPISSESGKVIAFGGRALGDDLPKYLNSPETPIYTKSSVLYHLDRAKEEMRKGDAVVLVEGYMDAIAVARAGISNVVASCGTSLTESQVKLLGRFTRRVIVNYDPDAAGQAATERSLAVLLEQNCDVRVLALPGGKDPDSFIRASGAAEYRKLLQSAAAYLDYLVSRARLLGLETAEQKLRAINFLMPHLQRIPNALLRSEWASRISQQLRVEEPVLREALRRAASERRGQVKLEPTFGARAAKPAERRLLKMLLDIDDFRARLAEEIGGGELHRGLETEKIFVMLLPICQTGAPLDLASLLPELGDTDRRLLNEIAFEAAPDASWDDAEACLRVLRVAQLRRQLRSLEEQNAQGLAHEQLLTRQAKLQEIKGMIAQLEGRFAQA